MFLLSLVPDERERHSCCPQSEVREDELVNGLELSENFLLEFQRREEPFNTLHFG